MYTYIFLCLHGHLFIIYIVHTLYDMYIYMYICIYIEYILSYICMYIHHIHTIYIHSIYVMFLCVYAYVLGVHMCGIV